MSSADLSARYMTLSAADTKDSNQLLDVGGRSLGEQSQQLRSLLEATIIIILNKNKLSLVMKI